MLTDNEYANSCENERNHSTRINITRRITNSAQVNGPTPAKLSRSRLADRQRFASWLSRGLTRWRPAR